jgi:hypothetical protein
MEIATINGEAALLATVDGDVAGSVQFEVDDGRVVGLRLVLNPGKLGGLR